MGEILKTVNLLSRNVVFIDDNPVERDAMQAAYPDIRVLGDLPLYFKRILMWSAETQVAQLTNESVLRTDMVQSQIKRDETSKGMTRDVFLASLELAVEIEVIRSTDHKKFARAFELINKTNQFNTTGIRLSASDAQSHFDDGGLFYTFAVADRHTPYGLVGVLMTKNADILQYVMSCRVAGLNVEDGVLATVLGLLPADRQICTARMIHTDANLLCREVYQRAGFSNEGEIWTRNLQIELPTMPSHLAISLEGGH
ncbi:hypothetical protein MPOCJGCO_4515 [Methylobacterium trifolii]|uniref:N-acetyltransferase domain-containing protein n=2 Tax=Methylobacterium trifolii TaxID=1003092 RepID=A0ABQ4U690_9HYPH|nr:hypothetical protein MPOCJGCO_4515 [Methylobacterium trifolii]